MNSDRLYKCDRCGSVSFYLESNVMGYEITCTECEYSEQLV